MGIDYSGGMIIGELGELIPEPEDCEEEEITFREWTEDNGMSSMSKHYDADDSDCYFGFEIKDIPVSEMNDDWFNMVKEKASEFERLTGVPARLIGTQNIW